MNKQYINFTHKFLMCMGLVMLYITMVYIVPTELNNPFGTNTIITIKLSYVPLACLYYYNTFYNNLETN